MSDWTDAELGRILPAALEDPPASLVETVESVFDFALVTSAMTDAELAELLSLEAADAGVRGGDGVERREYRCGEYTLVLVVDFHDRTIEGQFLPPTEAVVELVDREGSTTDRAIIPGTGNFGLRADLAPQVVLVEVLGAELSKYRTGWLPF